MQYIDTDKNGIDYVTIEPSGEKIEISCFGKSTCESICKKIYNIAKERNLKIKDNILAAAYEFSKGTLFSADEYKKEYDL